MVEIADTPRKIKKFGRRRPVKAYAMSGVELNAAIRRMPRPARARLAHDLADGSISVHRLTVQQAARIVWATPAAGQ